MIINELNDLHELEFDLIADSWDSSDFRSRYAELDDTIFLDGQEPPVVQCPQLVELEETDHE